MIYSTLALAALAASSALPNLGSLVHLHAAKHAVIDTRISTTLYNSGNIFSDIKVDGRTYTVASKHTLTIKAPVGTPVYAASRMAGHSRGDLLLTLAPEMNQEVIRVN